MTTHKGFTIIELIMSIVITGIIAIIGGMVLLRAFTGYYTAQSLNKLTSIGSVAMMRMSNELARAVSFSSLGASSVTFTSADGTVIAYSVSGSNLNRIENSGSSYTLTNNLNTLSFSYYDSNLAVTATPASIRAVTISLTLQANNNTMALIDTVYLENM